jgi:hypothetical protein
VKTHLQSTDVPSTQPSKGRIFDVFVAERWMAKGRCVGEEPDLWFPSMGEHGTHTAHAIELCEHCPVAQECFDYAMNYDGFPRPLLGIWGGTTHHERRHVREEQRRNAS